MHSPPPPPRRAGTPALRKGLERRGLEIDVREEVQRAVHLRAAERDHDGPVASRPPPRTACRCARPPRNTPSRTARGIGIPSLFSRATLSSSRRRARSPTRTSRSARIAHEEDSFCSRTYSASIASSRRAASRDDARRGARAKPRSSSSEEPRPFQPAGSVQRLRRFRSRPVDVRDVLLRLPPRSAAVRFRPALTTSRAGALSGVNVREEVGGAAPARPEARRPNTRGAAIGTRQRRRDRVFDEVRETHGRGAQEVVFLAGQTVLIVDVQGERLRSRVAARAHHARRRRRPTSGSACFLRGRPSAALRAPVAVAVVAPADAQHDVRVGRASASAREVPRGSPRALPERRRRRRARSRRRTRSTPPRTSCRVPPPGRRTPRTRTRRAGWPCPGRSAPATTRASRSSARRARARRAATAVGRRRRNASREISLARLEGPRPAGATREPPRAARRTSRKAPRASATAGGPEDQAALRQTHSATLRRARRGRHRNMFATSTRTLSLSYSFVGQPRATRGQSQARCATMTPSANAMVARDLLPPRARRAPSHRASRGRARGGGFSRRNRRRDRDAPAVVVSRSAAPLAEARASPRRRERRHRAPATTPASSACPPRSRRSPWCSRRCSSPMEEVLLPGSARVLHLYEALPRAPGRGHRADRRFVRTSRSIRPPRTSRVCASTKSRRWCAWRRSSEDVGAKVVIVGESRVAMMDVVESDPYVRARFTAVPTMGAAGTLAYTPSDDEMAEVGSPTSSNRGATSTLRTGC